MRAAILTLTGLAALLPLTDGAYAVHFAFNPNSAIGIRQQGSLIPFAIVATAFLPCSILIVLERRKAKGIWFSNSARLK